MTQIKLLQPYPAILLQEKKDRALLVSDLHIGWERTLRIKGVHIPSQTSKIKNILLKLIEETKPKHLILLGDIKDSITKISTEEWKDIPEFFDRIQDEVPKIQIILGNHDGNLEPLVPETVRIVPSGGISFGDVGLFHGHAWPTPKLLECRTLITGHIHPMVIIRDRIGFRITKQVFINVKCNAEKLAKSLLKHLGSRRTEISKVLFEQFKIQLNVLQFFIMPSFNQFLGGQPINTRKENKEKNESYISPILRSGCIKMDEAEVYLLDGTFLGTVKQLKKLS